MDTNDWQQQEQLLATASAKIARSVDRILRADQRFGWKAIGRRMQPKLSDVVAQLAVTKMMLGWAVYHPSLEFSLSNEAINLLDSITMAELVASAVEKKNQTDYEFAMKNLRERFEF